MASVTRIPTPDATTAPVHAPEGASRPIVLYLFTYAILVSTYFIIRSGGRWVDSDAQGLAVQALHNAATLFPLSGGYTNGYGFPVFSHALLLLSGVSWAGILQVVYPLFSAFLVVPAWALYRELTGSARGATLATILLFSQPEFLFVILRGSHERLLRTCMILGVLLLIRSFRFRNSPVQFAAHVLFFYFLAYGIISTNVLFGLSFVTALATALLAAWLLGQWRAPMLGLATATTGRLIWVTMAVLGLGFLFMFYIYPPASTVLSVFNQMGQRLFAIVFTTETAENPYAVVQQGWVSVQSYAILSASDYLLMGGSLAIWGWQGYQWFRRDKQPASMASWLLWLFYGAFMAQGALAIMGDRSGVAGGNWQHRAFPGFVLVATAVVAEAATKLDLSTIKRSIAAALLLLLSVAAMLKATNEPSLSNTWTFYTNAEVGALRWTDRHIEASSIWTGLDGRLVRLPETGLATPTQGNRWFYDPSLVLSPEMRIFVISDILRFQSSRISRPLPAGDMDNQIFDNGTVQTYRLRPRSIYQR